MFGLKPAILFFIFCLFYVFIVCFCILFPAFSWKFVRISFWLIEMFLSLFCRIAFLLVDLGSTLCVSVSLCVCVSGNFILLGHVKYRTLTLFCVPLGSLIYNIIDLNISVPDSVIIFASTIKHNLENSKGEVYLPMFLYTMFFISFLMFQSFFLKKSFLFWLENFFSNSSRVCLLAENSLSFPLSKNVFISCSFLKDISLNIGFWVDSSFSTWKMMCYFLLATVISNEKSAIIRVVVPL